MLEKYPLGKVGVVSVVSLLLLVLVGTALPLSAAVTQNSGSHQTFFANLSAAPGIKSSASGVAEFWLTNSGTVLHYILIVNNIQNVFMAHIHFSDGSIILWLYPNPNNVGLKGQKGCLGVLSGGNPSACPGLIKGKFDGVLAQGIITASNLKPSDCAGCNGFSFAKMVSEIKAGNTFVNVHTVANPGGEIQGTILT